MSEIKHIGRKINILSHKIKRRIGKVSLEYGISSMQAKILGYIFHQAPKRDIFQKTIEEEFDIRRSSVTSVLSLMEKNGLIERVSVCEDASHQAPKRDIFQKTIEEEFDIRRSSVTSVLSLMEKNGLIERVSVCEDARLKKIILTDKGIEVHKSVYKEIEIVESIIYDSLSKEELELFSEILERLSKKIAD